MNDGGTKKILMIGWEYPPLNSGGLGIACQALAQTLADRGMSIFFILPKKMEVNYPGIKFYFTASNFSEKIPPHFFSYCYGDSNYGRDLIGQVMNYTKLVVEKIKIKKLNFDIIHAHDWLTFPAALAVKKKCQKPFVAHIHAIEFDRTGRGDWKSSKIANIEKEGLKKADKIIANSYYTRSNIINCYKIAPSKIEVVHNAISGSDTRKVLNHPSHFFKDKKIVLFVGRLTIQKGVDYFLRAAQLVLKQNPKVIFLIVGDGELKEQAIDLAAELGIIKQVIFTGFLRGDKLTKVYQMADLYVLPSVSEPFGITPLEAIKQNTPVIISKNSGVQEVLKGALRIDFWDTKKMAEKMLAVLRYQPLEKKLIEDGKKDLKFINWNKAAGEVEGIYDELLNG